MYGQVTGSHGIGLFLESGKVLIHSDKLQFASHKINTMVRLQYEAQLDSSVYWASAYGFPRIALELNYLRYGNNDVLGESIGFLPIIKFPIVRFYHSSLEFCVGYGIALMTRRYDRYKNKLNYAVSTILINQAHFGLYYQYNFNAYKGIELGFSFWHNSNGGYQSPNYGVNAIHLALGYHYRFIKKPLFTYKSTPYLKDRFPIQLELNIGFALNEKHLINGPKYLVTASELRLKVFTSKVFLISMGFETDLNRAHVDYLLNSYMAYSRTVAKSKARRYALSVGGELLFGDIGLGTQIGYYLSGEVIPFPLYNKLYLRYYFLGNSKWIPRLHVDVVLKSHLARAEYLALRLGITLKK